MADEDDDGFAQLCLRCEGAVPVYPIDVAMVIMKKVAPSKVHLG